MPNAAAKSTLLVLGIGANLSDRLKNLREARARLAALPLSVTAVSQVYETPPAGGPPQPDYLNAALAVTTTLSPEALLAGCLEIERALGRRRPDPIRWGPRTIDIDLLWWEGGPFRSAHLTLPHPRLRERAFALRPLLDVAPEAADPSDGRPYRELLAGLAPIRCLGALDG
ncbi:MAG: 2-amino-4-hydroxy-6-hydroxymethyldihydropteridine diphosphokinase [Polyangiaceae bacterium]